MSSRPHGILRAGYPHLTTLGMWRVMNFPTDIALGDNDEIYVLLRSEGVPTVRIWSIDDMDELTDDLKGFGSYGTSDGQFIWPVNILRDSSGTFFISDEATNRITLLDDNGDFIAKFGTKGTEAGQFNGPSGIAFDTEGNLVVVDTKNHRIQRYTKDGKYLGGFGEFGSNPGQLHSPWGIHVDEKNDIYVSDWGNNRVQVFSSIGDLKFLFGEPGQLDGQFNRPTGITVDNHGDIYVADWGNNRVLMFNQYGDYIWSFAGDAILSKVARNYMLTNAVSNGLRESAKLEKEQYLRRPRSVRIDSEFRLWIPDFESYRIQVYKKDFVELDKTQFTAPTRNPTLDVT